MFPWSVMPSAGWPSSTAAWTRSSTRAAPSSIENSVWVWRCVNDRGAQLCRLPDGGDCRPPRVLHRLWTSYSCVIPTIAQCGRRRPGTAQRRGRPSRPCGRSQPGRVADGPYGARAGYRLVPDRPDQRALQVGAGPATGPARRRERPLAHLVELGPGCHLLGHQCGLDAVEEALEPADQLGLGDPQLGLRRGRRSRRG